MKALHLSLIAIAGIGVIISSCFPNVYAPCVIGSTGARLCAGSDLNDSMDESNYKNIESLGSAITSAVDQAESNATLLIYTDVPWQGTLSTSTNSTILSGNSADSQYSFACNYNDTYFITLGSAGRTETARGIWTVANVIQDGKMLDIGVNRLANGRLNLSGQCHTAQFPMSNTGMVSFTTDKTIYQYGDTIQISGVVLPDLQRSFYVLTSTIVDSTGMVMRKDSTGFGNLDTFSFDVQAKGGLWKPGNYRVLVDVAKSVAEKDITINPVQPKSNLKSENHIPGWIKNTVKWWVDGKVSDTEFRQAIQYLIEQRILNVPYYYSVNMSEQSIMGWIKSGSSLWADGKISDDEFIVVIKYLNFKFETYSMPGIVSQK